MNKLTKASIAGAAGVLLLLGGAGTLAYWNSGASLDANQTINSGELKITAEGGWVNAPDIWVPGDEVSYEGEIEITAKGTNLVATLAVDEDSITGNDELVDYLDLSFTIVGALPANVVANVDGTYTITESTDPVTVDVKVTVAFDEESPNASQVKSADLGGVQFLLTQNSN